MRRFIVVVLLSAAAFATAQAKGWVDQSNAFTQRLLSVEFEHSPEQGSQEGLAKYDDRISNPTLADELAERAELVAVLAELKTQGAAETDENVAEDLEILRKAFDLRFRTEDF